LDSNKTVLGHVKCKHGLTIDDKSGGNITLHSGRVGIDRKGYVSHKFQNIVGNGRRQRRRCKPRKHGEEK
jgi:hypothetical protein